MSMAPRMTAKTWPLRPKYLGGEPSEDLPDDMFNGIPDECDEANGFLTCCGC